MASLADSIGVGLLGSDYISLRRTQSELVNSYKTLLGLDRPKDRAPYDSSLLGFAEDRVLRALPPSLRDYAKRFIDMKAWEGMKIVKGFIGLAKDDFKGAAAGAISRMYPTDAAAEEAAQKERLGLVIKPKDAVHLEWEKDNNSQDGESGFTGYKVQLYKGAEIKLTSVDRSNEVANTELDNILKFQPREDTLWYITIDRYADSSRGFKSALPKIPDFKAEFSDNTIEYLKWLPAITYRYNRRQVTSGAQSDYGWGGSFSQISSIQRGTSFSITLQDDIHHNFSKYAKEVMNRSANYEDASITYWECLIHKISLHILDRQWRETERYNLLGLLVSDGANSYNPNMEGEITFEFIIVGELSGGNNRHIESIEDEVVQQTALPSDLEGARKPWEFDPTKNG